MRVNKVVQQNQLFARLVIELDSGEELDELIADLNIIVADHYYREFPKLHQLHAQIGEALRHDKREI